MLLILDLDDTIFETRSMDMTAFDPAKRIIEAFALRNYGTAVSKKIIEEIKSKPFDVVAKKYKLPQHIQEKFYHTIQSIPYNLNIQPFVDYPALQKLPFPKFLVTTGMKKLQRAKIDALQINNDFEKIFIDDPFDKVRKFKKSYFQQIIGEENPKNIWVIGDNPESELKAGKELNLNTVQRLNQNNVKSEFADHSIKKFDELLEIIEKSTQ